MTDPSTALQSRAWVEIDLDALCENALHVQRAARPQAGLLPMVKADAYGLGMERVVAALVRSLPRGSLWGFGVATVAEGERLRSSGWAGPLLVFSPLPPGEYRRAAEAGLTLCLSSLEALDRWTAMAGGVRRQLGFHLEVDTGIGRAGLPWHQAAEWGAEVARRAAERLRWEGCFTHFHSADEPDLAPTELQWARLQQALAALPPEGEHQPRRLIHAANSAGALRLPGRAWDLVRPGIYLYGGGVGAEAQPRAVVSLRARLVLTRQVKAETTVGYGATYRATGLERWGTLGIGYGDGLRRALAPAGGSALLQGRRVPLIGRISMDMTVVNLSEVPEAAAGEVATLIGRDGDAQITLDEVAARCATISYEILTGLTPRLPRVYAGGEATFRGLAGN